jgi:hypothetical protein
MKTNKKSNEINIRKLTKLSAGSSYGVTLPISVVRKWGWKGRQKLQLIIDEKTKTIKIKDWVQ